MATILSTGTGNWSTGATWVGGVAPGANDVGQIEATHVVTITADLTVQKIVLNGGNLIVQAGKTITYSDVATNGISIIATSSFTSQGTAALPVIMTMASANPTYPWTIRLYDVTGADTRTLTFTYTEFRRGKMMLGNDTNLLDFPTAPGLTDPFISDITPLVRDIRLTTHEIVGRSIGDRSYNRSVSCGVVNIEGNLPIDGWAFQTLVDIIASKQRISLFTDRHHIPKGKIERYRFGRRRGLNIPFSLTVREDN